MLRKNTPVKFARPISTMRTVFELVESGVETRAEIVEQSKLVIGKVRAALFNLTFIGAIVRYEDEQGRSRYTTPNKVAISAGECLKGVRSIFDVR